MTDDADLDKLAEAIANGEDIDWSRWERVLSPEKLKAFKTLQDVSKGQEAFETVEPLERGYQIFEELGRGAYGTVFRARDLALGREVALKVFNKETFPSGEARRRFLTEARNLAQIKHRNVVQIFSIDEEDDRIRLSLELIDGQTLEQFVRENGTVSSEEAARVGIELCGALSAVHAKGMVHMDLKPANVMRETGGRIVLLDFGFTRSRNARAESAIGGTPMFMAPEQFLADGDVGPLTDIYGLGALLYWIVAGESAYAAKSFEDLKQCVLTKQAVPLVDRVPDIPPGFAAIVSRAMSRNPGDRFHSAGAFLETLTEFQSGKQDRPLGAVSRTVVPSRKRALHRAGWIGAASLGLMGITLYFAKPVFSGPPALDVDCTLYALRDGHNVRLEKGDTVHVGDRLFMEVRANRPAWLYIFNQDAAGLSYTLFPLTGMTPLNPLEQGTAHRLPGLRGREEEYWEVNSAGGVEKLFVLASDKMDDRGELARQLIPEASPDAIPIRVDQIPQDKRRDFFRGIGRITESPSAAKGPTVMTDIWDELCRKSEANESAKCIVLELESKP